MSDISIVDMMTVEDLLPLTPASFQILLVLAAGPAHGYAIMLETERLTLGQTHLGPGTLYRTIQKLLDDQLIEATDAGELDERRQPYRLTRLGTTVARAEAARLATLVRVAQRRGLLTQPARPRRGATP